MLKEHRTTLGGVELRASQRGENYIADIYGYAALFDTRSELLYGMFFEQIAPGAFDGVLDNDVRCLVDHESGNILARSSAGNMRFGVDKKGLWYESGVPDTGVGRDLMLNMKLGNIRESSFGFSIARNGDEWSYDEEGREIRTIKKISRLYDVSPVAFPAYADTEVALRSLDDWKKSPENRQKPDPDATNQQTEMDKLVVCVRELVVALKPDQASVIDQINTRLSELDEMRNSFEEFVERTERRLTSLRANFGAKR